MAREGASRAVLGPGTGLGVAGLVRARRMWIPVAGEGGHIDLGPRTARDLEIWPHLDRIEGRVSAEEVLSGRGLVNLYKAICTADGKERRHADPADVTEAAARGEAEALEAVRLFATCLGRVAGDLALIFMARGGVYIAGGIVPRFLPFLRASGFRERFLAKGRFAAYLEPVSVQVVTHPNPGLLGAAVALREAAVAA